MVRVRGFEPPTSAFQVRSSGLSELHPVELAFPTGIEPACLPVRSRGLVQLSYGKNWYDVWESNPARVACKASLRPGGRPVVLGRGFEPRSPALQAGAFTRLAFRACGLRESNSRHRSGTPRPCQ